MPVRRGGAGAVAAAAAMLAAQLVAPARAGAQGVELAPAYRAGERTRVEQMVSARLRIDVPSPDRERVLVVQQEKRQSYIEEVLEAADGVRTRVRRSYVVDRESARTGAGAGPGEETVTTSDLEGRSIVIDGSGTDVSVTAEDGGPIASHAGLDLRDLGELIPRRALAAGESFDASPELVSRLFRPASEPPREASCHVTFVGEADRGGERCARFALELHMVEGDDAEQVTLHASGDLFYAISAGRPWALDLSGRLEMTGRRGEQSYGGTGEITYRMATSWARERDDQAPPEPGRRGD